MNQATFRPVSTACWPRASRKNVFPVPDGPQTTRFSRRWTHSRVRSACWVGAGIEDAVGCPGVEGLAGGEPGGVAAGGERGAVPAGDFLGEQGLMTSTGSQRWALAVAITLRGRAGGCAAAAAAASALRGPRAAAARSGRRRRDGGSWPGSCWWRASGHLAGLAVVGCAVVCVERGPGAGALGQRAGPRWPGCWPARGAVRGGPGSRRGRPRRTGRGPRRARAPSRPRRRSSELGQGDRVRPS